MKIILNKFGFFLILVAVLFNACSELDDEYQQPISTGTTVHPAGFARDHSEPIKENNWDMDECKKCHGADYAGGVAMNSCNRCHRSTPESCTTCHGTRSVNAAPPRDVSGNTSPSIVTVGAHQAHLIGNSISAGIQCSECHIIPRNYKDPGHIDNLNTIKVYFNSPLANTVTAGRVSTTMTANFINNGQDIECANTYCHGNFTNGNNYTPKWTGGSNEIVCGSCHSLAPKPPHTQVRACFACHEEVVDRNMNIIDKSKHINGKLEVYEDVLTEW
jgi:predicted CxxxxCH...CXXCH cytochrome family protein